MKYITNIESEEKRSTSKRSTPNSMELMTMYSKEEHLTEEHLKWNITLRMNSNILPALVSPIPKSTQ